jgi:raffinose/stachyose/melibiose transport system substrate-binding protein
MMKKTNRYLSLLLSVAMVLALFAGLSVSATAEAAPVHIQVWHQTPTDDNSEFLKKAEEITQKTYPNFSVEYFVGGDADVYMQKVLMAADSGNLPDVFLTTCANIENLYDKDVLLDITNDVKGDAEWTSRFNANALDNQYYYTGDKLYGVPINSECQGWFLNKKLFDQIGKDIPVKWEDWVDCVKAFKAAGIQPIAAGPVDTWARWGYDLIFSRYGFQDHAADFKSGKTKFADQVAVPAFSRMQELYEIGAYADDAATTKYEQALAEFKAGKAAIFTTGSWALKSLNESESANDFVFSWGPEFSDSTYNQKVGTKLTSWTAWASKKVGDDPNVKQQVLAFLKAISDPEAVSYYVEQEQVISCYKYENSGKISTLYASALEKLADDYAPVTEISALIDPAFETAYWTACSAVMTGTATAQEAAQQLDDAMALILS